jgi:hypothetical protein
MMNDPLANAYLKVIEEETSSGIADETKKQVGKTFGNAESDKNAKDVEPDSATENADKDMEKAKEDKEHSVEGTDGEAKKLEKSSFNNPFDLLYNKILKEEEAFNFSTGDNSLQPDSSFDMNSTEDDGLEEFDDETEEGGEEVTLTINREVAQQLHDLLSSVLSSEESEEEGEEEMGEEGEEGMDEVEMGEEEEVKQEAVEAEVVGHALVDVEKLNKGMNNPSNKVVKGAVPVTNKTAETPNTGKDTDGELKQHSTEPAVKKLQSKKQDVGGVHVGKTLFDNK